MGQFLFVAIVAGFEMYIRPIIKVVVHLILILHLNHDIFVGGVCIGGQPYGFHIEGALSCTTGTVIFKNETSLFSSGGQFSAPSFYVSGNKKILQSR